MSSIFPSWSLVRSGGRARPPGGNSVGPGGGRLLRSRFVRRISVVGTSGAGKSTVGRRLALGLGVPFVELDSIYHQPGWVPLTAEEFRRRVAEAAAGDGWVIDGNYSKARPLVWARADTVVSLDLPRWTGVWQDTRRRPWWGPGPTPCSGATCRAGR